MDRVPRKDRGEKLGDRVHRFSQLHVYEFHADKLGQNLNLNSKTLLGNAVFIGNIEINNLQTSNCIITGTTIGGWTIDATKISITGMELDSDNNRFRVYSGDNYVDITSGGITGYDSVLGTTFKLLTDGSAPEFSSGVIKECVYEIYTSGVIRTNADVANNGGLIINNTEMKGYNSGGNLTFRVIYDGTDEGDFFVGNAAGNKIDWDASGGVMTIVGTITATGGDFSGNLTCTGKITAGTGNNVGVLDGSDGTYRIYVGHATPASAPFRVNKLGDLWASNVSVTGKINTTEGWITGTLSVENVITLGKTDTQGLIKSYGKSAYGSGQGFWLEFTSGNVPRLDLYKDANNYFQYDGNKILIKAANFELDGSGNITATNVTLTGVITANTGHIGGASGWTISSKTLTGAADSVITGGIIQTAASGQRVVINESGNTNSIKFYDSESAHACTIYSSGEKLVLDGILTFSSWVYMEAEARLYLDGTAVARTYIQAVPIGGGHKMEFVIDDSAGSTTAFVVDYNSNVRLTAGDFSVPAGKAIILDGSGGNDKMVFQNSRIEFFVNGVLEGYVDANGFVST